MPSDEFEKFLSSLPESQRAEIQKAQELGKEISNGTLPFSFNWQNVIKL